MTRAAFSPPIAIATATGLALAIATAAYLAHGGWTYEGAAAAARLTARESFLWFVIAWSASALARLWPGGWRTALLRRRRSIGLGFAASHTVHLGALLIAILVFDHGAKPATVIGGGIGYLFVFAMADADQAMTNHRKESRAVSRAAAAAPSKVQPPCAR